ncbi:MAG: MmcQ/YjbR family DNA-binding protein [Christensenellales bacterium]|jgi:predicted DNA-binding protein (MmcQ/YjbR family)
MKENNLDQIMDYLLKKPGAHIDFPFGADTPVIKVSGKMFALAGSMSGEPSISYKCEPLMADALRREYDAVKPGYYLNKRHWNTISLNGSLTDEQLMEFGDISYALVLKTLTKAERAALESEGDKRMSGPGPEWGGVI